MNPNRALMRVIEASLFEQSEDWSHSEYYLINTKRKMTIWIANGAYGLEVHFKGANVTIPFGWKRRLRRAVDVCIGKNLVKEFKNEPQQSSGPCQVPA